MKGKTKVYEKKGRGECIFVPRGAAVSSMVLLVASTSPTYGCSASPMSLNFEEALCIALL